MQRTADLRIIATRPHLGERRVSLFAVLLVACVAVSALMASWLPLQLSIASVFLFAGPHNWFEFRYFLTRMPVRFGRSRNFFLLAFGGIGVLTLSYVRCRCLIRWGCGKAATGWRRSPCGTRLCSCGLGCWFGNGGNRNRDTTGPWHSVRRLACVP